MKTVIIDNYDSFTYNLAHLVKELGAETDVLRNDKFRLEELEPYDKIILSPGPGVPEEAGLLLDVIRTYAGRKPILGVCLGEQAIGQVFGGKLVNLEEVFHGVQTEIRMKGEGLRIRDEGLGGRIMKVFLSKKTISSAVYPIGFPSDDTTPGWSIRRTFPKRWPLPPSAPKDKSWR